MKTKTANGKTRNTVSANEIYMAQNRTIHKCCGLLGMPYEEHKKEWLGLAGEIAGRAVGSLRELTLSERYWMIADMKRKGCAVMNPWVPAKLRTWKTGDEDAASPDVDRAPSLSGADLERRGALMGKIEAFKLESGNPWSYYHAIAKQMFGIDHLRFCDASKLRKIVAALVYDAKRNGRKYE